MLPASSQSQEIEASTGDDFTQMRQPESFPYFTQIRNTEAKAVLQDVGLHLGRIFLEWAGDTIKLSLVTAASRSSDNSAFVGAGIDLASRLVDAVVT